MNSSTLRFLGGAIWAALSLAGHAAAIEMTLDADLREAPRGLLHATMNIPVQPGAVTLLYPKWIPGEHGPTGPIRDLSGIKISASGRALTWRRDLENMYALHVEVPAAVTSIEVSADYLGPVGGGGFSTGP